MRKANVEDIFSALTSSNVYCGKFSSPFSKINTS